MKLQHKAWLLILAAVGVVTLLAIVVTGQTISRSFAALEDERALHEGSAPDASCPSRRRNC